LETVMSKLGRVWVVTVCAVLGACGADAIDNADDFANGNGKGRKDAGTEPVEVPAPVEGDTDASVVADAGIPLVADASVSDAARRDAAVVADSAVSDAGAPVVVPPPPQCTAVFYRDADEDGFGDPAVALVSCTKPNGYVDNKSDCYDANKLAKPGQLTFSMEHRGDGSYDFDCDGVETGAPYPIAQCPTITEEDQRCVALPFRIPSDPKCDYDAMVRKWEEVRNGWWIAPPPCGQIGRDGVAMRWTREGGYTCSAPSSPSGAIVGRVQTCR
jgi:hypothetical protein